MRVNRDFWKFLPLEAVEKRTGWDAISGSFWGRSSIVGVYNALRK